MVERMPQGSASSEASRGADRPSAGVSRRGVLLVTGAPCSGLDALATGIVALGLRGPKTTEPSGHETEGEDTATSRTIASLHEDAFGLFGTSWDDPAPVPRDISSWPGVGELGDRMAEALETEYAGATECVVSDQGIARLLPLWRALVKRLGFDPSHAIVVRDPADAASELEQTSGVPFAKGILLWLWYMLDAERETRTTRRWFCTYGDATSDPVAAGHRACVALGLASAGDDSTIADRVEAGDAQAHVKNELESSEGALGWASRVHDELMRAAAGQSEPSADALDEVARLLSDAERAYRPVVRHAQLATAEAERLLDRERDQPDEVARLEAEVDARDQHIAWYREQLESVERSFSWRITKPIRAMKGWLKRLRDGP